MSRREAMLEAIEKNGVVASSGDLLGVAGITDRSELHNILYSLQKRGKVTFKERHIGAALNLTKIRSTKRKEPMETVVEEAAQAETTVAVIVDADKAEPKKSTRHTLLDWVSSQPKDKDGWVMATTGDIAGHLDVEPNLVAAIMKQLEDKDEVELVRASGPSGGRPRIIGLRSSADRDAARASKIKQFAKDLWREMPSTPMLDEYLQAKDLASKSPWLVFTSDPLYEEARLLKETVQHLLEQADSGT